MKGVRGLNRVLLQLLKTSSQYILPLYNFSSYYSFQLVILRLHLPNTVDASAAPVLRCIRCLKDVVFPFPPTDTWDIMRRLPPVDDEVYYVLPVDKDVDNVQFEVAIVRTQLEELEVRVCRLEGVIESIKRRWYLLFIIPIPACLLFFI